jgi:hypothetical protein
MCAASTFPNTGDGFSKSGNPTIEQLYRTSTLGPDSPSPKDPRCRRIGGTSTGSSKGESPPVPVHGLPSPPSADVCVRTAHPKAKCVGLDDLEFLSAGNAQALAEMQRNLAQQGVMSVGKGKADA